MLNLTGYNQLPFLPSSLFCVFAVVFCVFAHYLMGELNVKREDDEVLAQYLSSLTKTLAPKSATLPIPLLRNAERGYPVDYNGAQA